MPFVWKSFQINVLISRYPCKILEFLWNYGADFNINIDINRASNCQEQSENAYYTKHDNNSS